MTVCYWCGAKDTLADVGKELDDGKYKMVQCLKCKNAYYVVNKEKMNKPKPMTNEEYLRSCNTEQLAEFLFRVWENGYHSTIDIRIPFSIPFDTKWLKQTHKE